MEIGLDVTGRMPVPLWEVGGLLGGASTEGGG